MATDEGVGDLKIMIPSSWRRSMLLSRSTQGFQDYASYIRHLIREDCEGAGHPVPERE